MLKAGFLGKNQMAVFVCSSRLKRTLVTGGPVSKHLVNIFYVSTYLGSQGCGKNGPSGLLSRVGERIIEVVMEMQ